MQICEKLLSLLNRPIIHMLVFALIIGSYFYIDQPLALYLAQLNLKTNFVFLKTISKTGVGGFYFVGFTALALMNRYFLKNKIWEQKFWFLLITVLIPSLICAGLKLLLGRARPSLFINDHIYGFYGFKTSVAYWSFPSGHTTTIISVALGLSILFPRASFALVSAGFCVALSRILLVQHYFSDILVASYLATLEIAVILWLCQRYRWLELAWGECIPKNKLFFHQKQSI